MIALLPELTVLRGGGDLATGVAWRLTRAGWPVIVCELADPLAVRRTVAFATAVTEGSIEIEGLVGRLADNADHAVELARAGDVGVLVSPGLPDVGADVIVDGRLAKRNIDTAITDAPLVIGIGPGFSPGRDCHVAVESLRGHHLGRALWDRDPAPDTGVPDEVAGFGAERVVRSPVAGTARWRVTIGDLVAEGTPLGEVGGVELRAPCGGVVRGLIRHGRQVEAGLKVGDIDPRADSSACWEISDKALAIGGGVVEAVLSWPQQS